MPDSISNGFDLTRINAALQGRLGWHQPTGIDITLSVENLSATSGRYYDRGFHKAVTIANYYATQENESIDSAAFNQLLQDEDKAAIMRCVNAVFNKPALIEHKVNYTRSAYLLNQTVPNGGNFCGYRMNVAPGDYAVAINTIALYFDKAMTFNFYMFNDLLKEPVYTQSVTTVANSQTIVSMNNWVVNYLNSQTDGTNMGGVWYFGYYQKDIADQGGHALFEQLNIWADTKIFGAYPFQSVANSGATDFNRVSPSVNFWTYGFNFEASSYRDYTQLIVANPGIWDEARGLTMAIEIIEQIKYSTRSDSTQRNTADFVKAIDIDMNASSGQNNQYPYASGIKQRLEREFERINANFWAKPASISVPIGNMDWWNAPYYEGMDINNLPARNLPR